MESNNQDQVEVLHNNTENEQCHENENVETELSLAPVEVSKAK
jgi:hypothetical protein